MTERGELSEMENLFLALADRTRLKLLNLLRDGEVSVGWLADVLGESQPKISRHLAYLRNAEIVSVRRDGKRMNYKIALPINSAAFDILKNTLDRLASQTEMRADLETLTRLRLADKEQRSVGSSADAHIFGETNMKRQSNRELEIFLL